MKKLILLLVSSMLSSCALIEAYQMKPFDPNEYQLITEIRVDARQYKTECVDAIQSKTNAYILMRKSELFMSYSEHIPYNNNVTKASIELNSMAKGIAEQYQKNDKVSPVFCKIKFETIEHSAETIQKVIGDKPR